MTPIKVAFILGDGYSGSTLLDLILGSHSRMVGLGEIDAEAFDAFIGQNQLCTCLFRARECHFWAKVLLRLREINGREAVKLGGTNGNADGVMQKTVDLYRAVQHVSGAESLVDSSKLFERARALAESGLVEPRVIHLVRDGRGVAYSHLKRGESFEQAVFHWLKKNAEVQDWLRADKAPEHILVRYEELCARPTETARRVCEFLGGEWEPQMMRFGQRVHHNVRGNTMRFLIKDSAVKLDEAWKEKLRAEDINLFEELAGAAAQQLGYP